MVSNALFLMAATKPNESSKPHLCQKEAWFKIHKVCNLIKFNQNQWNKRFSRALFKIPSTEQKSLKNIVSLPMNSKINYIKIWEIQSWLQRIDMFWISFDSLKLYDLLSQIHAKTRRKSHIYVSFCQNILFLHWKDCKFFIQNHILRKLSFGI